VATRDVVRVDDPGLANDYGVTNPFELIEFDVLLEPAGSPRSGDQGLMVFSPT
jgi:hypothetical protein